MRVTDALDRYITQLEADGRSPHTVNQARRHLRLFAETMGDPLVRDLRPEDLAKFLSADSVMKHRKPSSANALRSSLRCFCGYVHAAGYAPLNAARLVRRARCGPSRPRAISEADAEKLSRTLREAHGPIAARDRVAVELMLRAGLRVGSLVALDVEDFDGDAVRLRRLKGGGSDVAFLPEETAALVRAFIGDRRSGPLLGDRISTRHVARRVGYWGERAGIGRIHPHQLRHSFGQRVFDRTQDVLTTGAALCHRSLASTAIYARASERSLRAAVAL